MASVASPQLQSRLLATPASTWIDWPARYWRRITLYLSFALPLIGLAIWAESRGYAHPELTLLEHRANLVRAGGSAMTGIRYLYPPIPTLLAMALPHNELALSIITCLCSAIILGYLTRRLLSQVSLVTTAVLVLPLVAAPIMWYAASQLAPTVLALAFLAVALDGFIRFTSGAETEGGFVAGVALAASFLCDPAAVAYGVVMCAYAPLISHARYHRQGATAAICAVLCFPLAAIVVGWIFLVWKFTGRYPDDLHYAVGATPYAFPSGVTHQLVQALKSVGVDILHVPLYFAAMAMVAYRQRWAVLGLLLPPVSIVIVLWLGFAYGPIASYLLFTIVALVSISNRSQRRFEPMLVIVALGQLALVLAWPPTTAAFTQWVHAVT
jgi:hypothetical protein